MIIKDFSKDRESDDRTFMMTCPIPNSFISLINKVKRYIDSIDERHVSKNDSNGIEPYLHESFIFRTLLDAIITNINFNYRPNLPDEIYPVLQSLLLTDMFPPFLIDEINQELLDTYNEFYDLLYTIPALRQYSVTLANISDTANTITLYFVHHDFY